MSAVSGSTALLSWFMLARQTAAKDVSDINDQVGGAIVEGYAQAAIAAATKEAVDPADDDGGVAEPDVD